MPKEEEADENRATRHAACRQFLLWQFGKLSKDDQRVILSCYIHFARSIRVSEIPAILLKNKTRQLKMKMRFSYDVYDEVFNTKTGFRQITTTLATLKYFCEVMLLCLNHLYHFFSKKGLPHPPKWSPVAF